MIEFRLRYDEHTMLWQYQPSTESRWSEPMRYGKAVAAIARELQRDSIETSTEEDKRWSMPLPHQAKGRKSDKEKLEDLTNAYEIVGGKVQRIAFDAAERQKQQVDELLSLLEDGQ